MKSQNTGMRLAIGAAALALALTSGCGDDDSTGGNNNVEQDAGADADAGPVGETLVIRILDGDETGGGPMPFLEGATVTVDLPGGERVEHTTGADGRVTIEGIDWSVGTANIQAHFPDKTLATLLANDATSVAEAVAGSDEGDLEIWLADIEPEAQVPTFVDVSGSATGFVDPAHDYLVHAVGVLAGERWIGPCSDDYLLSVEAGAAFTLLALEHKINWVNNGLGYQLDLYRLMQLDVDPLLDATTIDLDLEAHEISLLTVDASVIRDFRADSSLNALPLIVKSFAANALHAVGWASYSNPNAAGDFFDVTHRWTEQAGIDSPYTLYQLIQGSFEQYSIMQLPGYPQGGVIQGLLDVPEWITPSNVSMAHPLHSPMEFELFNDVPIKQLLLLRNDGSTYAPVQVVFVHSRDRRVSFTIPAPPSTVDTAQLYGASALMGQLTVGHLAADRRWFERQAVPYLILIEP
ncbi:MAG: hypothetical protein ABI333_30390 [bacterium]